ncbi:MAG TPA: chemotaxis response regulator protein-glutamate methylesterase [Beijerinckiaceae bacterium]
MSAAFAVSPPSSAPSRPRVMVVDDSVVVRGLMARWLEESGAFQVVTTASNGRAAVDALDRVDPEIVLLDIDMPELDGISTLPLLLAKRPDIQVVMVSTLTQRNADISLRCMSLGAVDYLPKPESNRHVTTSTSFREELVMKLQALATSRRRRLGQAEPGRPAAARLAAPMPRPSPRPRALAVAPRYLLVGASTGGPKAVGEVLSHLGLAAQRVPILVVQHMPPVFTSAFADHLRTQVGLPAKEGAHGERPLAGHIYVAPGGRHMGLAKENGQIVLRLDDGPQVNFCRPAVDVLFRDAAALIGASALSVVLTGMGSDGTHGAKALVEAGGAVVVQDEATSTVWGMPGSIAKAGLAHDVLPLQEIAPALKTLMTGGAA